MNKKAKEVILPLYQYTKRPAPLLNGLEEIFRALVLDETMLMEIIKEVRNECNYPYYIGGDGKPHMIDVASVVHHMDTAADNIAFHCETEHGEGVFYQFAMEIRRLDALFSKMEETIKAYEDAVNMLNVYLSSCKKNEVSQMMCRKIFEKVKPPRPIVTYING